MNNKKISKKTIKNKLDKLISNIVKSQGKCQKCNQKSPLVQLQTAHIFSRSNLSVRWDLDNVLCLCAKCHFWAHKNPLEFAEFVKKLLGEEKYNNLISKAHKTKKWDITELITYYENLKKNFKIE